MELKTKAKDNRLQKLLLSAKADMPAKVVLPILWGRKLLFNEDPQTVINELELADKSSVVQALLHAGYLSGNPIQWSLNPERISPANLPSLPQNRRNEANPAQTKPSASTHSLRTLVANYQALLKKAKAPAVDMNARNKTAMLRRLLKKHSPAELADLLPQFFMAQSASRQFNLDQFEPWQRRTKR